jgi:hypothetical protein
MSYPLSEIPELASEQQRLLELHNHDHRFKELIYKDPMLRVWVRGEIAELGPESVALTWVAYDFPDTGWMVREWNAKLNIPLGRSMPIGGGHGGMWYNMMYMDRIVGFIIADPSCEMQKIDPQFIEGLAKFPGAYQRQQERYNSQPDGCRSNSF